MNQHTYKFFLKVEDGWEAIYEVCKEARFSILFEHFILMDDKSGRPFINLFKEKAKNGVKVKVLLDAIGSSHLLQFSLETELKSAGVEIEFFNTIIPWTVRHESHWFFRDHRKVVVIDSTVGLTGGLCFEESMKDWRDTCVQIEGSVVKDMERSFNVMWERAKKRRGMRQTRMKLDEEHSFIFLTNEPFVRRRYLYYELLERIKRSRSGIRFTTPYFVPNSRLLRGLCRAARRGVAVSLFIPAPSDHKLIDIATESYFDKLLKAGIKVFRGYPPINHTKSGTIDGEWGTIGSLNLDYVSLRYNFEANLVTTDKNFISALDEQFANDCLKAELLRFDVWSKRPFYRKLLEFLIGPFRFLL